MTTDKKPLIVAVDDEVDFTGMMKDYFEPRGYEIHVANKGVTGIELIEAKMPDIIILDLKMPGVSGDEVLVLAKKIKPTAHVIFVTAYDDGGKTKSRLLKAGAYAYLDKPLQSLRILEEVVLTAFSGTERAQ